MYDHFILSQNRIKWTDPGQSVDGQNTDGRIDQRIEIECFDLIQSGNKTATRH